MEFEKLDIVNLVVVVGLVIALIAAIFYNHNDLSTIISAGCWVIGLTRYE